MQVPVTVMQEQEIEEVVEVGRRTSPVVQGIQVGQYQSYQAQDYQSYQTQDHGVGVGLGLLRRDQVHSDAPVAQSAPSGISACRLSCEFVFSTQPLH